MSPRKTSTQPEPATSGLRAVVYARVSVSNGSDSLEAQRDYCRDYAGSLGAEIVAEHEDDGISGTKGSDARDGLSAALATLEDGCADVLIVHRLDRLARELHLQEAILARAWDAGGQVHETVSGEVLQDDPSDPMRTFARQVCGAARQLERGMIVARMQGGRRRARAAGRHIGGTRPYGYTVAEDGTLEPLEEEQRVIRRVRELRAAGAGIREIGREIGLHPEAVRRVLAREAAEPSK
jgi:DNA invertase Pin-like site-specific DNA recombinase